MRFVILICIGLVAAYWLDSVLYDDIGIQIAP